MHSQVDIRPDDGLSQRESHLVSHQHRIVAVLLNVRQVPWEQLRNVLIEKYVFNFLLSCHIAHDFSHEVELVLVQ